MNIHLHGHISDCIRDFGPVYAFWLFTFERLNGILGSYHTNCHDISLQLMRRFLVNHDYGFSNWPEEYWDEFEAIISQCQYNKGSLSFKSLSNSMLSKNVSSFPPIHEMTWQAHQKAALHPIISGLVGHNKFSILTLYQKCKAVSLRGFCLGAHNSRYATSCHVMTLQLQNLSGPLQFARIKILCKSRYNS